MHQNRVYLMGCESMQSVEIKIECGLALMAIRVFMVMVDNNHLSRRILHGLEDSSNELQGN